MSTTKNASEVVVLRGGQTVPLPALRVAWSLEDRGLHLQVDPATDELVVAPRERLTDEDRTQLREHREPIVALVRYCDEVRA